MIDTLHLDKDLYPYGFMATTIKSKDNVSPDKSYRGNFYQMFWVKAGEVTLEIDNNTVLITEGECAFIGINQIFRVETATFFESYLVRFTEDFYCRHEIDARFIDSCKFFDNSEYVLKYRLHASLRKILVQYHQSLLYICRQPFDELMYHFAHNTIERALLFSQKELMDSAYGPVAIRKKADQDLGNHFRQLVKENYKQKKQVHFYADKLNLSLKRLTEICNSMYGQAPKKLISEQVILEAKRLLQHSTLNIKEIAFELMFQEPGNFIRFFVTSTDMTPGEYREQFKLKENPQALSR